MHVAFPLDLGNVQVFLQPSVGERGSLVLTSPAGRFGEPGAYVVVRGGRGGLHAARVPLHERFEVFVDEEGVLRTDHTLALWGRPALRLHYRLARWQE